MTKGIKALRHVAALKRSEQQQARPVERRIPIKDAQADYYRRLEEGVTAAQNQLQAAVTAILAGAGVLAAQGVRLERNGNGFDLVCMDMTEVVKHTGAPPATAPPPVAPPAIPTPETP